MNDTMRRPRARSDVVFRRLADDEWALFDPVAARVHALNLSAALVWEHCDGERDVAALARVVQEVFGQPPPAVVDDVQAVLDRLTDEGLITWT